MQRDASSVFLHLNHHLHLHHHLLQQQQQQHQQRARSAFVSVRPRHFLAVPSASPSVASGGDAATNSCGQGAAATAVGSDLVNYRELVQLQQMQQQFCGGGGGGGHVRREGSGRFRDFRVETILGGGAEEEEEEERKEQGAGEGPTAGKDGCEFSWLHCTRYKPPRLPKVRRRADGASRRTGRSPRVPFSSAQVAALEWRFRQAHYLSGADVADLSASLYLSHNRVKIWFQNRRARERRARRLAAEKGDLCPLHPSTGTAGDTRAGPVPPAPPPPPAASSSSSSSSASTLSFFPRCALFLQGAEFVPLLGPSLQQHLARERHVSPPGPAAPRANGPGSAEHV